MKSFTNSARTLLSTLSITLFLALTACGGGGGSTATSGSVVASAPVTTPVGTTTPAPAPVVVPPAVPSVPEVKPVTYTTTDAQVIANVKSSNIDYNPGFYGRAEGTWRWHDVSTPHVAVYIPAPGTAEEQSYADKVKSSIALINLKLNGALVLEATSLPVGANHIQISYNTSYVPAGFTDYASGNYCANVSTGPYSGNQIVPDWQNGIASAPVYVNLGNGKCDVTQDIIVHEFGHALGLTNHFNGFGIGPAISEEYWDTLATLYGNPQSTTATNLVVKRAFK